MRSAETVLKTKTTVKKGKILMSIHLKKTPILAIAAVATLTAAVLPATAQTEGSVVGAGEFEGRSDHITTGGVSVVTTSGGAVVILESDFSLDGAPDPHVGFGAGGTYDPASDVGVLASNTGLQAYHVPASLDLSAYDEVYIWCEEFSVPLGVATIR